jgi:hypothetical protein
MMTHDDDADKVPSLGACLDDLRAFVLEAARRGATFHDFEQGLWQHVLRAGHAATAEFLQRQGTGDLGAAVQLPDGQEARRLAEPHPRPLTGVFGTFTLCRTCYGTREGQKVAFVPLDNRLQLPAGKFSYLLQDFNGLLATEDPFAQVAQALERILGLRQHVDSLERQAQHLAAHVEPYRDAPPPPPAQEEEPILVRSADAKGVPLRCAADAPPIRSHDHKRGPKTGRKKQAIVGAVYSVAPLPRTSQQIVALLFREPDAPEAPRPQRPKPCHKRVMARLNASTDAAGAAHDGLAEVFAWMAGQLRDRNPSAGKVVVNLFDGDERLQQAKQADAVPGRQVDILDLLHVTPKLWAAAALFAPRASPRAQEQVRAWLLRVLRGQVAAVVRELKQKGRAAGLKGSQAKELHKVCGYLHKRRKQMRYHQYLQAGYPIASGVIEGACRHYVKDRMERTGMSWRQPGAQAMLQLRSLALNGDWDDFQDFYRRREGDVLYPHRCLLEEISWPLAA